MQGVCFRAEAQELARELGLVGSVRNAADVSVEIEAEGEEEALKKLLAWCKVGPDGARVDRLDASWKEVAEPSYFDFRIV